MYILDINIGKIFQAAIVLFRQKEKPSGSGSNETQDPLETDTVQFCSLEEPPLQPPPPQSPARGPQPASPRRPTLSAVGAGILLARTRLLVAGSRDSYVCPGENIEGECRELHNIESTLGRCNEINEETRRELSGNILRLADALNRKLQPNEFNQQFLTDLRGLSNEILTATTPLEQRNTRVIARLRTIVDHQTFNSRLTEGQRSFFQNLHTNLQENGLGSLSNTRLQTAISDAMNHRLAYTRRLGTYANDSLYRAMSELEGFLHEERTSRGISP